MSWPVIMVALAAIAFVTLFAGFGLFAWVLLSDEACAATSIAESERSGPDPST